MFKKLLASFDNENSGYSARKLTAFWLIVLLTFIEVKFTDKSNLIEIAIIDLTGGLLCLGIITAEQIIKFKNGKDEHKQEQPPA